MGTILSIISIISLLAGVGGWLTRRWYDYKRLQAEKRRIEAEYEKKLTEKAVQIRARLIEEQTKLGQMGDSEALKWIIEQVKE